ncbi:fasciclin domain-containing protein [Saccharicrinis sp. GN24d3]|uniref:fasciclin domain-containing protein n=1 Tax=Saccharicrinis sp. GN24d3 TaxID=3458416 RepID=UPI004035ACCC
MKVNYLFILLIGVCLLFGCNDDFNNYHKDQRENVQATNVLSYLQNHSEYKDFVSELKAQDLDQWLLSNKAITVYALNNEAMVALKAQTGGELKQVLLNHLSTGIYYVSDLERMTRVKTELGKYHTIDKNTELTLDGINLVGNQVICGNGVIHQAESNFTIIPDLYSQIMKLGDEYSLIKEYIVDADTMIFDRENSKPLKIDELGQTVYDTVWIKQNRVLQSGKYDALEEDYFYTAFVPSDALLNEAYEPTIQNIEQATGKQVEKSLKKIMYEWCHESVFHQGKVDDVTKDTLLTLINGNLFKTGVQKINKDSRVLASNGELYTLENFRLPRSLYMSAVQFRPQNLWKNNNQQVINSFRQVIAGAEQWTNRDAPDQTGWWSQYMIEGTDARVEFKTFRVINNNEIVEMPIVPGEYDIYIKGWNSGFNFETRTHYQKLTFLKEFRGDEELNPCGDAIEYPAFEPENQLETGKYLGRISIPDEWGIRPIVMAVSAGTQIPGRGPINMVVHVRMIPTNNNY